MSEPQRTLSWSAAPEPLHEASAIWALDPALLALTVEHISTRVAVIDRDYRYVYANRETLKFMGLPAERVIGRHMSEVLDAALYRSFVPLLQRLFAGESLHIEGWVDYERQGRRFREQALLPYLPDGGPVQSIIVCGLDHTRQRLQEQQLHASEALKAAILDHALVALITADAQAQVVEFNPAAAAMFGCTREQALGRKFNEVTGLPHLLPVMAEPSLNQRQSVNARRADGGEFPVEMLQWRTDVNDQAFYTSSIIDLSQRHAAEAQIARQREALRQTEKLSAMGSLLAGVAHELNNPLSIVMGRASLLQERLAGTPVADDIGADLQRIREAADRCGRIVRTFLNMARSRPAQHSQVALHELVQAAAEMLAYNFRSHGVELLLELASELPCVDADGDQIGQIVLNLLVNAQQALASHEGQRQVRVSTGLAPASQAASARLWLRVADTGPGIDAAARQKLFEPFFTTKIEGSGTGLGLSLSRSLAREHGGDLVLEPAATGLGATFLLTLPLRQPATQAPGLGHPSLKVPMAGPETTTATPRARVLVVDDEVEMCALMQAMLESGGYETASAHTVGQAMALLGAGDVSAIISDLRMPDQDGASFWRQVQSKYPPLVARMLFVTGDALSAQASDFLRHSGCRSLEKPFTRRQLLARVEQMLG